VLLLPPNRSWPHCGATGGENLRPLVSGRGAASFVVVWLTTVPATNRTLGWLRPPRPQFPRHAGHSALILALVAGVITACGALHRPWGEIVIGPGEPVLLGFAVDADTTGAVSGLPSQTPSGDGSRVAGHSIRLVPISVHCQAATPSAIAPTPDALTNLAGYIGGACSSGCIYAEGLLYRQRTTMIASGCTSSAVVQQGYPTVFRIAWDDDAQAHVTADYARSGLHSQRVAVVRDTSVYARSMTTAFASRFRASGGRVGEVEIPVTGPVDTAQVAARVRSSGAGAVFFAVGRADSAGLYRSLQPSLGPLPVIASDTVLGPSAAELPDGLVAVGLAKQNGVWGSELDGSGTGAAPFSGQANDAERLYAAALNKVATRRGDGSLAIGRERLRDTLADIELTGDTGRLGFDSRGERRHDTGAALYRISNGQATLLNEYKR